MGVTVGIDSNAKVACGIRPDISCINGVPGETATRTSHPAATSPNPRKTVWSSPPRSPLSLLASRTFRKDPFHLVSLPVSRLSGES